MKLPTPVRANLAPVLTGIVAAICITGCVAFQRIRREPNATLLSAIKLHGGQIEYHRGFGFQSAHVKAISLPAAALKEIDPVAFHVFPRLRVLHLTQIPAGNSGETYETACCVNGKQELTALVTEYRKAGLMR